MNPYTFPIKGDLSRADVVVLSQAAQQAKRHIFEFGIGASTVIIACSTSTQCTSFENEQRWVNKVQHNLSLYEEWCLQKPSILLHDYNQDEITKLYNIHDRPDFIFVDCLSSRRRQVMSALFAVADPGTLFMLHDCRSLTHQKTVVDLLGDSFQQVEFIKPCYRDSNMVLVKKSEFVPYKNWNATEKFNNRCSWDKDDIGVIDGVDYDTEKD